jgi:serine/threonine protein kinase
MCLSHLLGSSRIKIDIFNKILITSNVIKMANNLVPFLYTEYDFIGSGTYGNVYRGGINPLQENYYTLDHDKINTYDDDSSDDSDDSHDSDGDDEVESKLTYAIKEFRSHNDRGISADFIREIQMYQIFDGCKYIPKIESIDIRYKRIAMEYMPTTLFHSLDVIEEYKKPKILGQVLNAMKCFHDYGLIHRDLHFKNILIDKNDNVKICDFGSSILISNSCKDKHWRLHTDKITMLWFRAPEIFCEYEHYTSAVDIWSFGILCLFLYGYRIKHEKDIDIIQEICSNYILPEDSFIEIMEKPDKFDSSGNLVSSTEEDNFLDILFSNSNTTSVKCIDELKCPELLKEILRRVLLIDFRKRPTANDLIKELFFEGDPINECDKYSIYMNELPNKEYITLGKIDNSSIPNNPSITYNMRRKVLKWIIEVHEENKSKIFTIVNNIRIFDLYLSKAKNIKVNELQLVGMAAMSLSDKYCEIYNRDLSDYIGDYSGIEIINMTNNVFYGLDGVTYRLKCEYPELDRSDKMDHLGLILNNFELMTGHEDEIHRSIYSD